MNQDLSHLESKVRNSQLKVKKVRLGRNRWRNESGQGLSEYLIIAIVVAILVIVGIRVFGTSVSQKLETATQEVEGLKEGPDKSSPGDDSSKGTKNLSSGNRQSDDSIGGDRPTSRGGGRSGGGSATEGGGGGGAGGGGAGGDDISSIKEGGIGDSSYKPVEEVEIDWTFFWWIFGIMVVLATVYLFKFSKTFKEKGKKKGKKKSKKKISFKRGESGQAMVEFVISAITFLFVILGIIQMAMCLNAQTMVRYAAYNAARAGIVHGGDEDRMQEAARISLLAIFPRHGRADHRRGLTENYLSAIATDSNPLLTYLGRPITQVRVIDNGRYDNDAVITFDDPDQSENALLTVQVEHQYELVIPLVNRILFYVYNWRFGRGLGGLVGPYEGPNQTLDKLSAETHRLRNQGGAFGFQGIEYRIPLIATYTMRLQSDYVVP